MLRTYGFALAAGMVATINPCGFALLPAYLAAFVGLDNDRPQRHAFARAIKVSAVLTAGFVTVFGLVGIVISSLLGSINEYLPYATVAIGVLLVALGIWMLLGHELRVPVPKLNRGGADGTLVSMYLFGVSYAIASLSCTIGPFLTATSSTATEGSFLSRIVSFVMYGVGMGLVVGVLTVAVALAKDGIVSRFRSLLPVINKVAAVLMIIAGLYIAYYGWYEIRLFILGDDVSSDPIIGAGLSIQAWLSGFAPTRANVWSWVLAIVAILVIGAGIGRLLDQRRGRSEPTSDPGSV